jgi:hypothetical protein
MTGDPKSRGADDGAQPVQPAGRPSGLAPEEVAEPGRKQDPADADWLSMATADPALFLKDSGSE